MTRWIRPNYMLFPNFVLGLQYRRKNHEMQASEFIFLPHPLTKTNEMLANFIYIRLYTQPGGVHNWSVHGIIKSMLTLVKTIKDAC